MRSAFGLFLVLSLCLVTVDLPAEADELAAADFSTAVVGATLPPGWRLAKLPGVTPTRFRIARIDGVTGLRMEADDAGAALVRPLQVDLGLTPVLRWRWRVEQLVAGADIRRKAGDDVPARLYVLFDYPLERLPLLERGKIELARRIAGDLVPAAALCYVWDASLPAGTSLWNPYSKRVRVIVLRSGGARLGEWVTETRDLAADFRAAFGEPPPPVSGIALGADTDQTGGSAAAWFGDIRFLGR